MNLPLHVDRTEPADTHLRERDYFDDLQDDQTWGLEDRAPRVRRALYCRAAKEGNAPTTRESTAAPPGGSVTGSAILPAARPDTGTAA